MIDVSPPASDADVLAGPPATVRIGEGGQRALVVSLTETGLARARREGLAAITPLALRMAGIQGAAIADLVWRFTTGAARGLPPRVDGPETLDALLGRPRPLDAPVIATLVNTADKVHEVLHVPADLGWFAGHFPGEPILAGIVQLRWAIDAARTLSGVAEGPSSIQRLKFKQPIWPASILDLVVTRVAGDSGVAFAIRSATGEHSSGSLHYRKP